jgi:hypothetical protein
MNFQFTSTDTKLTATVRNGGCGLTAADLRAVTTWQAQDFQFNMHTGYHGTDGGHYIYLYTGTAPARDMPRIWLQGTKSGTVENADKGGLKAKHISDAARVVTANQALFVKIVKNTTA